MPNFRINKSSSQVREPLFSINQSQGGAWINSGIDVTDITELLFVSTNNNEEDYTHTVKVVDIPVYTGGQDVYLCVFSATLIGKNFNVRIYNDNLYVSYNETGSNSKVVSVYSGGLGL